MKYNKIFRTLAVAVILSLLVIAIPATPALAAGESIELSPDRGTFGDRIYVNGEDFDPDDLVYIYFSSQEAETRDEIDEEITVWYKRSGSALVGSVGDSDEGEFSKYFYVPEELNRGDDAPEDVESGTTYYVYTTYSDSDRIEAVAEFTVRGIELDPTEGPAGTEVEITGVGFDGRDDITIEYNGEDIDIESGDDDTDSDGDFTCTILIPESAAGEHTITVEDESDNIEEVEFDAEPAITISSDSGSPASEVIISGTGFKASKSITITFDANEVTISPAAVISDSDGSFSNVKLTVPALVTGTYEVKATDGTNDDALNFTILITASCSPTTGNVGTPLTVTGTGFVAGRTLSIKYDTTEVATDIVGTDGAFSVTFDAPASPSGTHTITATDGTTIRQFTFTMESTPPPAPEPLLPLMESIIEEEAPLYLDWEDVADPSGVTYTLQVASDINFTSLVLEKEGLTLSEYTLTEQKRKTLVPIEEEEATYYWQVKAIDDASNDSGWSGTGSFTIPYPLLPPSTPTTPADFTMPDWAIYLAFGVGALLVGVLGFWLGKRAAYRY